MNDGNPAENGAGKLKKYMLFLIFLIRKIKEGEFQKKNLSFFTLFLYVHTQGKYIFKVFSEIKINIFLC